jgi:hypothetical protein
MYVRNCAAILVKILQRHFKLLNQAYGEGCISRMQCYEWFKRFEGGRMSVGEDPRPGRPYTSTDDDHVERVRAVMQMVMKTFLRKS